MDGLDVARAIRNLGLTTPILVLTARADEVDLVVGLDAGADDYVTKPFRLAELLARVRALLRRTRRRPGRRGRAARAERPGRRRRAPRLPGRARAAPHRQGVRPAARARRRGRHRRRPRDAHARGLGLGPDRARPRPSTCTCRGCAASSATTPTPRATSPRCAAWASGSRRRRERRAGLTRAPSRPAGDDRRGHRRGRPARLPARLLRRAAGPRQRDAGALRSAPSQPRGAVDFRVDEDIAVHRAHARALHRRRDGELPASVLVRRPTATSYQAGRADRGPQPVRASVRVRHRRDRRRSYVSWWDVFWLSARVIALVVVAAVVAFARRHRDGDLAGEPARRAARLPRGVRRAARLRPGAAAARAVRRRGDRPRRRRARAQRGPDGRAPRRRAAVRRRRLPPAAHPADRAVHAARGDHARDRRRGRPRGGPDLPRAGRAARRASSTTCSASSRRRPGRHHRGGPAARRRAPAGGGVGADVRARRAAGSSSRSTATTQVLATPGALAQVLATLIENSLKHGAGTTTVRSRAGGPCGRGRRRGRRRGAGRARRARAADLRARGHLRARAPASGSPSPATSSPPTAVGSSWRSAGPRCSRCSCRACRPRLRPDVVLPLGRGGLGADRTAAGGDRSAGVGSRRPGRAR